MYRRIGCGRGDGITDVEVEAASYCSQRQCFVSLDHQLRVLWHLRWGQFAEAEAALGNVFPAEEKSLNVGANDLFVSFAAPAESLFHEFFQEFVGHVHQMGEGAHDDHITRPIVAGGAGQFFDRQAKGPRVAFQFELCGIEYNYAVATDFRGMAVVGLLIKGDQDINIVSRRHDRVHGDPGLRPSGPTQYLGGERGKGQGVITHLGGRLGQAFGGSYDTLSAFTGEPNDEVSHLHKGRPPSSL